MRFLLIEDSSSLATAVVDRLKLDGHAVDVAADLETAQSYLAATGYDLILLDIMLPDGDGRDFLKAHRESENDTPVIVLTARSEVNDRVGVLDLGADDYITKPFEFSELEARCRAVLRRRGGGARNEKKIGDTVFDSLSGTLTVSGRVEHLRNREMRLLEVFFSAPDRIFSKPHLVDRLVVTIAPLLVGGLNAVAQNHDNGLALPKLSRPQYQKLGNDIVLLGDLV